jgi:hypothetical protein
LITVSPSESEQAVPPRALYPKPFQLGEALGRPNDPEIQLRILRDALSLLHYPIEPGTIFTKDY